MAVSSPSATTSIIFDADVLIKLAQHPGNLAAIGAITNAVQDNTYRLVVPEPVLNAFNREKQNAAEAYWKTQRETIKKLRQLRQAFSFAEEISTFADRLTKELDAHTSDVPKTIQATEALLQKGELVPVTDTMKVMAADRLIQHKAPAVRAQNSSVNDGIIWEVVRERSSAGALIFVTDNYTDFSDPTHREKLHPELASEVPSGVKYCYHSLDGFRKKHIKDVEIVVERPATTTCPACREPISAIAAPRPSQYGGWSYQLYCGNCQIYIDTGDPYDE
jgi:hypothetical protein